MKCRNLKNPYRAKEWQKAFSLNEYINSNPDADK